jgi:hypothetical protein
MNKRLLIILLLGLVLTGCSMRFGNRLAGGSARTTQSPNPTSQAADFPTELPTRTPLPPPTITPTSSPDLSAIGLPAEALGTSAYDFAADFCSAEWSNGTQAVPCKSQNPASTSGYVTLLNGADQDIPQAIDILLMYPPRGSGYDTLVGRYPAFAAQKGDRFRAVLTCRAHNFCDVDFGLDYFDANGRTGLKHWSYLFTDSPIIVDYSLDSIAGRTVQFVLSVRRNGEGLQAYAAWLAPHIYRP